MSIKTALITGITGQDGSYLAELLLENGYEVHGMVRRSSSLNTSRIDHIYEEPFVDRNNFFLHYGDLTDTSNVSTLVNDIKPTEIYNLGAQSHVKVSFETPEYTANSDAIGTLRILEAIKNQKNDNIKFYQASTSEMYGKVQEVHQKETTPFYPRSPYGAAKMYGYWITINYREAYNIFSSNGILFNHESPRRGETFVSKKITKAAANIIKRKQECLYLGNLDAKRDWGHARDYVEAMHLILQHDEPDDFVIATGKMISVREFVERTFSYLQEEIIWEGEGLKEVGILKSTGKIVIRISEKYFRPTEVDELLGDSTKARRLLGWKPKYSLEDLIKEMVEYDLENN